MSDPNVLAEIAAARHVNDGWNDPNRVVHDGTAQVGDWLRVKSLNPMTLEKVAAPSAPPGHGIGGKSGAYYTPDYWQIVNGTPSLNELFLIPLVVARTIVLSKLCYDVFTAGAAGAVARLGIYTDGPDGYPTTLILQTGTSDSTTTGVKEITVSHTLVPGRYWLAYVSQVATAAIRCSGSRNGAVPNTYPSTPAIRPSHVKQLGVTGALPATFTTTLTTGQDGPYIYVKAA